MSFPTPSFSGARYVLTFIDDFSRRTWVYFLKYKSDVFDSFRVFKTFVEKQSGLSIRRIRTDNGGEYVNQAFRDFCSEHGLQHQFSVPYTPQQNGVAERKNRTLREMANCMIQSRSMDSSFWAEAVNCANYIQNRMPHKAVQHMTPEEAWSHVKPDVSSF
jgi:transposase InsO family protein